jgi:hypothetical protein
MISGYYILDDEKNIVPCDDFLKISKFIGMSVGRNSHNGIEVSTVFLSLEHGVDENGRPILFESMVFGGSHDGMQIRYCSWKDAEDGHASLLWVLTEDRMKKLDELGI